MQATVLVGEYSEPDYGDTCVSSTARPAILREPQDGIDVRIWLDDASPEEVAYTHKSAILRLSKDRR